MLIAFYRCTMDSVLTFSIFLLRWNVSIARRRVDMQSSRYRRQDHRLGVASSEFNIYKDRSLTRDQRSSLTFGTQFTTYLMTKLENASSVRTYRIMLEMKSVILITKIMFG